MKKLFLVFASLVIALSFGCGNDSQKQQAKSEPPKQVETKKPKEEFIKKESKNFLKKNK